MKKLFIVQKYIVANSIAEALKKEKKHSSAECFLDSEWRKANLILEHQNINKIGFTPK